MLPPNDSSAPAMAAKVKAQAKALEAALGRLIGQPLATAAGRAKRWSPRRPAMIGAFPSRAAALASLPPPRRRGYDQAEVAELNFDVMCALRLWDYPVLYWLSELLQPGARVLDAGGHFGTKYIAFQSHLSLKDVAWTVYDLPATVAAARAHQAAGRVPAAVGFVDDLAAAPEVDVLLASGLLQYLDRPLAEVIAALPKPPRHVILNKVATREGPTVVTLEKIGPARVPYQIRCRAAFEGELTAMGYALRDRWDIPPLGHVIDTHPELGRSVSRGYRLEFGG